MRILILGAGALGGYFGARLLAAGRDVTFLVRERSAQQLAAHGLQVISPAYGNLSLEHPPTILAENLHESFDLILLSCKAYDLPASMDAIAPAVGPATSIIPMLNGMAHLAALDQRFGPERVLGGTCLISAARDPDGIIHHLNDRDMFFFGDRGNASAPHLAAIASTLADANFKAQLRPNILQDMWDKWTFLASVAGINCLMRASIGDIVAAGGSALALQLYAECIAIAAAESRTPATSVQDLYRKTLSLPGSSFTASMLRDLEDHAPIEAHQILGDLLAHARHHQLATPLLEIAHIHVRCYEERRRRESTAA